MTALWRTPLHAAALVATLAGLSVPAASAQKAVFVVRHGEKVDESVDPLLSAKGQARAQTLARHLRGAGIKAIFVTQYKRTALTAAPLAAALGLKPVMVPAGDAPALVDHIRKHYPEDVVLVVGHSNTVPAILERLGHPDPVTIGDDEFDNLFVTVPRPGRPPLLLTLKY
jgi:broad specificity phosphatase PhoE